jgi:hypothetical protein
VNPVATPPSGRDALLEENPTWVKEPVVGTIYNDSVVFKVTEVLFGEIFQAVVVESGSRVNVIFVATVAQDGELVVPIYASPVTIIRKKLGTGEQIGLAINIENCCTVGTIAAGISSICIQEDTRLC